MYAYAMNAIMPDPIKMLYARKGNKSLRKLAAELGISAPYLSDIFKGQRTVGPKVLKALGLERSTKVTYRNANG